MARQIKVDYDRLVMNHTIVGIDEVGWGPVAGPIVVAAAAFKPGAQVPAFIKDSKKLSKAQLDHAYEYLVKSCVYAVEFRHVKSIEAVGPAACRNDMFCVVDKLVSQQVENPYTIIDGVVYPLKHSHGSAVIKADSIFHAVSAASIIAKVSRDQYMLKLHEQWPEYGFDQHKGYLTKKHKEALLEHGPMPEHRRNIKLIKDLYDNYKP